MSPTPDIHDALPTALAAATRRLLDERTRDGHWTGELSSSALATATAVFALAAADAEAHGDLVRRGLDWIDHHQNADGGWGDTVRSRSNLSTTALCWAALTAAHPPNDDDRRAGASAEGYLAARAGGLDGNALAAAISRRYGADRSFSAPILTMCALAGRLGPEPRAWKHVPQLPFELAACPHGMLKALRLPVVSYALPALVAIGQVRHRRRPTLNPVARLLRHLARGRTLRLLGEVQPASGGFLEAAPLTSFVLMSLAALRPAAPGGEGAPWAGVADRAAAFLAASARPDGSWPIDTNLATWVTSLSVGALPAGAGPSAVLDAPARQAVRQWLLDQQLRREHPYTHARPGGWAWTDLAGGVPDADDTAAALRALRQLGPIEETVRRAAAAGCEWLLDLQNDDGGVPTFCRGWGRLPFDRSSQDITAHALRAWSAWLDDLPAGLKLTAEGAVRNGIAFLARSQAADGSWTPLWFGNENAPGGATCVYGTARVLRALCELSGAGWPGVAQPADRGIAYVLSAQGSDGGWGGASHVPPTIEETAGAVDALAGFLLPPARAWPDLPAEQIALAVRAGSAWLIDRTSGGTEFAPAPIGLYFASLWYFEKLYPLIFTVSALSRAAAALGA